VFDFMNLSVIPGGVATSWLLTYAVHSTVILSGVWMLTRRGPLASPRHAVALWKAAAVAGVVTATVQTGTMLAGSSGRQADIDARWTQEIGQTSHTRFAFVSLEDGAAPIREPVFQGPSPSCRAALRERLADVRGGAAADDGLEALRERCGSGTRAGVPAWVVLALWMAGALFMCLRLVRGHRRFRDALDPSWPSGPRPRALLDALGGKAGFRGPVVLVEAPGLGSPVALQGRRIALPVHAPALMDDGELSAALAHELGHIVRRDPGWLLVLRVLEAVFFFQPLNRLARHGFQSASDFLADEWAVEHTGEPLSLARSLEKVSAWAETGPADLPVLAMARRDSPIVQRVRRIFALRETSRRQRLGPASTLLLLPALLLPPVWAPAHREVAVIVIREFRVEPPSEEATPDDRAPVVEARGEHRVIEMRAYAGS